MRTLYLDCGMGAAGDMLLAALLELHPNREDFLQRLNRALAGKAVVSAASDRKCGIVGTHVSVLIDGAEEGEEPHHEHHHHEQHHHAHTSVADVMAQLESMAVPQRAKDDAKAVYALLAEAESAVHGESVEQIHFHEVGTLDALSDVLGVCMLMNELAPERVLASPVCVGSGEVRCAHGILPVPTPATERLLRGIPVYAGEIRSELCTPTGAALLRHFVASFGPMPMMTVERSGYGTGKKDFPRANALRALLGESEGEGESLVELQCNLDDMSGEELAFALEQLLEHGALDAWFTPITMKKSRPAVLLSCLCHPEQKAQLQSVLLRHTSTLGVRETLHSRVKKARRSYTLDTPCGCVRVKVASGHGAESEKYEYDDLAAIARERGLSLREVKALLDEYKRV